MLEKHIRYIHYALIIASLLVFVATGRIDTYYQRASEQLNSLQNIIQHYDGHWLHEYIFNKFKFNDISFELYENIGGYLATIDQSNIVDTNGKIIECDSVNIFIPKWFIFTKDGITTTSLSESFRANYDNIRYKSKYLDRPTTITDTISFLNNLDKIQQAYIIKYFPQKGVFETNLGLINIDLKEASPDYLNENNWKNNNIADLALPNIKYTEIVDKKNYVKISYNYVIKTREFIPSDSLKTLSVNVQVETINTEQLMNSLFYEIARLKNVQTGSIKNQFQDFINLPDYFKRMPTDDLVSYFDDMKKKYESEVKMFGINIPRANISTWGIAFIVSFQLYLLLHLTSLCENYPIPSGRKIPIFPSILCYSNNVIAIYCSYISIVFFPFAAVIFGAGRTLIPLAQIRDR